MSVHTKKATITEVNDRMAVARFGPGMMDIMYLTRGFELRNLKGMVEVGQKVELRYERGPNYGLWFAYPDPS